MGADNGRHEIGDIVTPTNSTKLLSDEVRPVADGLERGETYTIKRIKRALDGAYSWDDIFLEGFTEPFCEFDLDTVERRESMTKIDELIEAGKKAPAMQDILALQADCEMQRNVSVADKGREYGTVEHIAVAAKAAALGEQSKAFYEACYNAREAISELKAERDRYWEALEEIAAKENWVAEGKEKGPIDEYDKGRVDGIFQFKRIARKALGDNDE